MKMTKKTIELVFDKRTDTWVTPCENQQGKVEKFFSTLNRDVDKTFDGCDNFW